ncbi:MAG: GDP-mannose 4,6-dehydratase [Candidatus Thermoplasmatota archaeon]|nr:GDP-mannose 4,6-dehydratase [Candidatus Thermoplasmatota archaeon]
MRILLAGGAGFLGSHLAEALVERGDYVVILDNLSSGLAANISGINKKIKFINADVSTSRTEETFDLVMNLASRASRKEWESFPVEVAKTNALGTDNLINIALRSKAKFLLASTSEIYGNPDVVPTPESYIGRVSSTGSRSPYDEGKRFAEALVKSYESQYALDSIIIRFFNTYGPRMRGGDLYGRVIDRFLQQALNNKPLTVYGSGMQTRSFTYVSDTVSAILKIIDNWKTGEVYNVGSDNETKIIDLARMVIKVTGSTSTIIQKEMPPDDPLRRAADVSKIKRMGWRQEIRLEEGLKLMFEDLK